MENLVLEFGLVQGTEHAEISAQQYLDNKEYLDNNFEVEFQNIIEGIPVGIVRVFEISDSEL